MHVLELTTSCLTVTIKGEQIILEGHNEGNIVQTVENSEVKVIRRFSSEK